jgi:hypothetical protein
MNLSAGRAIALISLLTGFAAPAASQTPGPAADVLGKWNLTFSTQQGVIPSTLVLKKEGDKIGGTIASDRGEGAVEARVKGQDLTVVFTFPTQNGPIPIQMDGTIDGDAVKGSFTAGGSPAGSWEGRKAKETPSQDSKDPKDSKTDLTGTWNVTLELPNMTATPTFVLKQDGEKLTGDYVSAQYGKFPISGTVKGADVSLSFSMNVEGTSLNVAYTGKVDKDEIKGSVSYGDMMSGTFTAARKK